MITKFNKFKLINESILRYKADFISILYKIKDNKIANYILSLNMKDIENIIPNYINITDKNDLVSFIPDSKITENDPSTLKTQEMKIGKFVKHILTITNNNNFTDSDIEKFVNEYKAAISQKQEFKYIIGDNIARIGYNTNYYEYKPGSVLYNSCMNNEFSYLTLYTKNEQLIKLLVLYADYKIDIETYDGQYIIDYPIIGRALVWKLSNEDFYFMDRIYYNDDDTYNKFINYAKENEIAFKLKNTYGSTQFTYNGKTRNYNLYVELDRSRFDSYPYMDTFRYLYNDTLSTFSPDDDFENEYYELTSTEGDFTIHGEESNYDIDGNRFRNSEMDEYVYSSFHDAYIKKDNDDLIHIHYNAGRTSMFSNPFILLVDDWVLKDDVKYSIFDDEYYLEKDVVWSDFHNSYILKHKAINIKGEYVYINYTREFYEKYPELK